MLLFPCRSSVLPLSILSLSSLYGMVSAQGSFQNTDLFMSLHNLQPIVHLFPISHTIKTNIPIIAMDLGNLTPAWP